LPDNVLGPTLDQVFVAEVVGVLEVQQRGHEADRQAGAPGGADARSGDHQGGAEQVCSRDGPSFPVSSHETRGQGRFDLGPGQALGQGGQRVLQVDHLVQAGAEEVGGHLVSRQAISLKFWLDYFNSQGIQGAEFRPQPFVYAGWGRFAGATY
jgi:hypothetical protein